MHAFNQSLKYDQRMHDADIRGSIAYAKALTKVDILTKDEEAKMVKGLKAVGKEWADGTVCSLPNRPIRQCLTGALVCYQRRRGYPYSERASPRRTYWLPQWKTSYWPFT
jgi:Lyase